MSELRGLSALGRSLGVQQELDDIVDPLKSKIGTSVFTDVSLKRNARLASNTPADVDSMLKEAPAKKDSEKPSVVPKTNPLGLELGTNPIRNADAATNAVDSPSALFSEIGQENKERIDLFRFELAVTTNRQEKERKEKEMRAFIGSTSSKEVSEKVLNELCTTGTIHDMFANLSARNKQDSVELIKNLKDLLEARAHDAIKSDAKQKQFTEYMTTFEKRAKERKLPQEEVLATLLQVGRVLDPENKLLHDNGPLLAKSMIRNAANPTGIDQGGHNTCNVTTLECRLYTQEPSVPTKLVADIAINGEITTKDGSIIRPGNLAPDLEARFDPTPDGLRNYASQIFQNTAINVYWNRKDTLPGGKMICKGNIQYRQGGPGEPSEYLLNTAESPPQIHKFRSIDSDHPWLNLDGLTDINAQITGRPSVNLGIQRYFYPSESKGVANVLTTGGLKEKLHEYKAKDSFPVIVVVDADKKPIGDGTGDLSPHVVTITDYDEEKGLVTIDNQWGSDDDFTGKDGQKSKMTVSELYSAMSLIPSTNFLWDNLKTSVKDIKSTDVLPPTTAALSSKLLRYGLSASAPLAVKGGLGALGEWGVPGAAKLLAATETKLGAGLLRAGTGLGALGAFAYANNLPAAFREGNARGTGKLTRVLLDSAGFDLGSQLTSKAVGAIGLKWAPARLSLMLAAGVATGTILDRALGDGAEIAGSTIYEMGREYLGEKYTIFRTPAKEKTELPTTLADFQVNKDKWKNLQSTFPTVLRQNKTIADLTLDRTSQLK